MGGINLKIIAPYKEEEEVVVGVWDWRNCEGSVRKRRRDEEKGRDLKNSDQAFSSFGDWEENQKTYFPVDLESSLIIYSSP